MGEKAKNILGLSDVTEKKVSLVKALVAELIGTLFLVFFGCGAAVAGSRSLGEERVKFLPSAFITQVALTFGLVVASVVQAIGHISGGHINPAVTIGVMCAGQMSILRGLLYMLVQYVGAIAGAALLAQITYNPDVLGANGLQPEIAPWQGLVVEFMVTLLLVLVVFGVCDSRRQDVKGSIPLAIGLTVGVCHLLSIGFTGAGMNPARTFGPLVIGGKYTPASDWIYFVGPYLGGVVAALLYTFVFKAKDADDL